MILHKPEMNAMVMVFGITCWNKLLDEVIHPNTALMFLFVCVVDTLKGLKNQLCVVKRILKRTKQL